MALRNNSEGIDISLPIDAEDGESDVNVKDDVVVAQLAPALLLPIEVASDEEENTTSYRSTTSVNGAYMLCMCTNSNT